MNWYLDLPTPNPRQVAVRYSVKAELEEDWGGWMGTRHEWGVICHVCADTDGLHPEPRRKPLMFSCRYHCRCKGR